VKVVILAGGLGTRLAEETSVRPKPMVEIGGLPILWHVMKIYSSYGFDDFIICAGYKGHMIKEYFANYALHMSDVTFDIGRNAVEVHDTKAEKWSVTVVNTGDATMTGGRIKRVQRYVGAEEFMMTYGDGVADVDLEALLAFHRAQGRWATVTATRPPGRFGALGLKGNLVDHFEEKPIGDGGYINGGFFVLSPRVFDLIEGDSTYWEREPMNRLAAEGQLAAFKHNGFWQPMDTPRERGLLESLWSSGKAPWRRW
jgi:glucose-1-phosphate cytidylyltransferase